MRISHERKFVYIAIHKTGSSSMRSLLEKYAQVISTTGDGEFGHHVYGADLQKSFMARGWAWDDYFKFTVVRHPLNRLYSMHNFRLKIGSSPPNDYHLKHALGFYRQCVDYWHNQREFATAIRSGALSVIPMTSWTHDPNGHCLMDRVLKLESLQEELQRVWALLGLNPEDLVAIPHRNRSSDSRIDPRDLLSHRDLQLVREQYRDDYERFGYS